MHAAYSGTAYAHPQSAAVTSPQALHSRGSSVLIAYPSDDEDDADELTQEGSSVAQDVNMDLSGEDVIHIEDNEVVNMDVDEHPAASVNVSPPNDSLFIPDHSATTAPHHPSSTDTMASTSDNANSQRDCKSEAPPSTRSPSIDAQSPAAFNSKTMSNITRTGHKRRSRVEDDPINAVVKELRQSGHSWEAIRQYLKNEDIKNGRPVGHYSDAALYGRWSRNAERIAAAKGESFDINAFKYKPFTKHHVDDDFFSKKRITAEADGNDSKEAQGNMRKKSRLLTDAEELRTPERKAMLMEAIGVVEDNYWMFVADALERTTGKFYDYRVLEASAKEANL